MEQNENAPLSKVEVCSLVILFLTVGLGTTYGVYLFAQACNEAMIRYSFTF
ncbi:MAG TPA: hypothetical protein P5056_02985 [Candidatus Paceibacterota bacterium]|nr:hypothetical protein [Candidatus Paceibacterota bacterium]